MDSGPGIVSRDSDEPLYKQVVRALEARMSVDGLGPGEILPSESALMDEFGVSRITVRQALAELEKLGQVVRRQGKGTFVGRPHVTQQLNRQAKTIIEALADRGVQPEVEILGIDRVEPPERVRDVLETGNGPVTRLRRRYQHNAKPIALVDLYLTLAMSGVAHVLAQEDHATETSYTVFEKEMNIAIKEAKYVIRSSDLSENAAGWLNMSPGDPCLTMDRITYSEDGKVLELMTFYYPTDTFEFEITLPRHERGLAVKLTEE